MAQLFRHGDVLIAAVETLPADARPCDGLVLASGELTGHAHRVQPHGRARLFDQAGQLFLTIDGDVAFVTHEEHAPIALQPGVYRVWRQREYIPGPFQARGMQHRDVLD